MTTKAISFLGYTRPDQPYRKTTYVYQGQECSTAFMAEATAHFFQQEINELLVIVTEEARKQNFAALQSALAGVVPIRPIHIPSGRNETELWEIFAAIECEIQSGDRIIFDITNGFRSLPVLALLAASLVRVVRGATLERMIYGAYDATQEGRTPVFDLTPFVRLLDWTTATDAFLRYGRADVLAGLAGGKGLAQHLRQLTDALQTSRPAEVMQTADHLRAAIADEHRTATPQRQPFTLLLDRIDKEYSDFGLSCPRDQQNAATVLRKQLAMISWYVNKGLYIQAMTSVREWIVSLVVCRAGRNLFDKRARNGAERLLNDDPKQRSSTDSAAIPQLEELRKLWREVREVRNSLAHAGMSHDAPQASEIIQQVKAVHARLDAFLGTNDAAR